jgi:lipopolysaccharide export system protein LptC
MSRTRIVRWLRVLLPLVALAILSTLFLLSKEPGEDPSIPYADVDAAELAREPQMVLPEFSGVTADGSAITLRADQVSTEGGEGGEASRLRMTWRAEDGLAADMTAPGGAVEEGRISLTGGVRITTSSGWAITTPQVDSPTGGDDGQAAIVAPEEVNAFAPFGQLSAGAMDLSRADAQGDHLLNFTDGVRLIYQP